MNLRVIINNFLIFSETISQIVFIYKKGDYIYSGDRESLLAIADPILPYNST